MRLPRALLVTVAFVAGCSLVFGVRAGPASAHTHPTPVELDAPAVVRVETYAQVSISLIEHNRTGVHIGLKQGAYTILLAGGSGFAVDPSGAIVTSPKVIDVDLKRAETYAVNKIFNERYGNAAPLPADQFATQTIQNTDPNDKMAERLQRCYQPNTTDDTGGCVVFSSRVVKVLPFVSSQKQYGDLPATVVGPAGQPGDVVVLKVGASSMPTVDLATSAKGVSAFSILGFSDVPSTGPSLKKIDGHFSSAGATDVKRDEDYEPLGASMAAGMLGGPVVAEGGQVVGFLSRRTGETPAGASDIVLVGPEAVRAALTAAGVSPHRGPTDAVYDNAMHNYKNRLYTPAIPSLAQTLKLYPGHALAAEALADSNNKKGTAAEATAPSAPRPAANRTAITPFQRTGLWVAAGIVLILIVALGILLFLRRRTRRAASPAGATDTSPTGPSTSTPRPGPPAAASPSFVSASNAATSPAAPTVGAGNAKDQSSVPRQRTIDQPRPDPVSQQETVFQPRPAFEPASAGPGPAPMSPSAFDSDATREISRTQLRADSSGPLHTCASCGERVFPSQTFCGHCGHRLR